MISEAIQRVIDAQQTVDTLAYGLRSIKTCGGESYCTGLHAGQLVEACAAASRTLGRDRVAVDGSSAAWWIRVALSQAREELREAKAARAELGGIRQQRLALAAA